MRARLRQIGMVAIMLGSLFSTLLLAAPAAAATGDCVDAAANDETIFGSVAFLYTTDCFRYDIVLSDGDIVNGTEDAYDGYGVLYESQAGSDHEYFTSTAGTLNGRTVSFEEVTMTSGLVASRQVYVPATGGEYARFYNEFYNPTGVPITIDVILENNLGSDTDTLIESTSSGDTSVTAADYWMTSSEDGDYCEFCDPVVGSVFDGIGAPDKIDEVVAGDGEGFPEWRWDDVTVQPGARVAYLSFTIQQELPAEAEAEAARIASSPPDIFAELSADQISRIQNFEPGVSASVSRLGAYATRNSRLCAVAGTNPCLLAVASVIDSAGQRVRGATVTIEVTDPSGATASYSGVTSGFGYASIAIPLSGHGTYTIVATDISGDGVFYDPSGDAVSQTTVRY